MKKTLALILLSAGSLFVSFEGQAQSFRYANEALLLSRYGIIGSARTTALGGSQVALGADIGSIAINPAAAGVFNRNEAIITPGLRVSGNEAFYLNNQSYNDKAKFYVPSLGVVFGSRAKDKSEGYLGGSFAISYQQLINFNDRFSYEGQNREHGLINRLEENFFFGYDDLLTDLAYEAFLVGDYYQLDEEGNRNYFYTPAYFPTEEFPVTQRETVSRSGNVSALSLAYGGNISDKFYFGAGVNLTGVNLRVEKGFEEIFEPEDFVPSYTVNEVQELTGGGANLSLGVIARLLPFVRVGLSYQTPTFYDLDERYLTSLSVNYNNFPINQQGIFLEDYENVELLQSASSEQTTEFLFQLRTPSRLNLGTAVFIGKSGFITADVEFVNYSNAKLTDEFNSLDEDNQAINEDFRSGVNFRTGGEYRYDLLRLRAGYAFNSDPYQGISDRDRSTQAVTAGAGIHFKNYFFDLALSHQFGDHYTSPYTFGDATNFARISNKTTTALLTLGVKF